MLKLRPYDPSDAETILRWVKNERAFRQWTADRYDRYPITPADMQKHYKEMSSGGRFYPMTACDDTGVVGHLILRYPGQTTEEVRLGFIIVDDARRGKGYGKRLLRLAIRYALEKLQAKRITLGVFENNLAAYSCYRAVGFRDVTGEKPEYYSVMGEKWKCLELEYCPEDIA